MKPIAEPNPVNLTQGFGGSGGARGGVAFSQWADLFQDLPKNDAQHIF